MGRHYTVTIELSQTTYHILDRLLAYLEGREAEAIQKKIDEATKIIGDTSADTQAKLENASKS